MWDEVLIFIQESRKLLGILRIRSSLISILSMLCTCLKPKDPVHQKGPVIILQNQFLSNKIVFSQRSNIINNLEELLNLLLGEICVWEKMAMT